MNEKLIILGIVILEMIVIGILKYQTRKLKSDYAYIRWQLEWYKEQYEKLYKILTNSDRGNK